MSDWRMWLASCRPAIRLVRMSSRAAEKSRRTRSSAAGGVDALAPESIPDVELAVDAPGLLVDPDDLGVQVLVAQDTR